MHNVIVLDMNHPAIQYLCKKDKRLSKVIEMVGPISYSPHDEDPYAFLIHEIIEQMLSVKAGRKIYGRLECLCKNKVTIDRVNSLTDEQLRSTGTSNAKVQYIRNVTNSILDGSLDFNELTALTDKEVIKELTQIRGIGTWTAKMYLLFVLDRPDVLPLEDGAFLQVFKWLYKTEDISRKTVEKKCKKWSPYSSVAARYFYKALDSGMTNDEFHLFK